MIVNLIWGALTNIRRRRFGSYLFFGTSLFIGGTLFLGNIARSALAFPETDQVRRFFLVLAYSSVAFGILFLAAISGLYSRERREELALYRIHGAQTFDIILLNGLEVFLVTFAGSLGGAALVLILIISRLLGLPTFFLGMTSLRLLKLVGIGGQAVFGVSFAAVVINALFTAHLLRRRTDDLLRGSP